MNATDMKLIEPRGFGLMTRYQAVNTCKDYLNIMLQAVADGNFDLARHYLSNGVLVACLEALSPNRDHMTVIMGDVYIDLMTKLESVQ